MNLIKDFKSFVVKGNIIDLAIGVVIGSAFGKVIASLVQDIIMPPLGYITGGINFSDNKLLIKSAVTDASGKEIAPANTINYGLFLQTILEFAIIALALFIVIKAVGSLSRKQKEELKPEPVLSAQEILLTEIRDLLKNQKEI